MGSRSERLKTTGDVLKPPCSRNEIARHLSVVEGQTVSGERIRQIEVKALAKLKKALADDPVIRDWLMENGMRSA